MTLSISPRFAEEETVETHHAFKKAVLTHEDSFTEVCDDSWESSRSSKQLDAIEFAKKIHRVRFLDSTSPGNKTSELPKFDLREIVQGKILGTGAFCQVRSFALEGCLSNLLSVHEPSTPLQVEPRKFMAKNCLRVKGDARYVIKTLSPSLFKNQSGLVQGMADMATETRILSRLEHPHVIKLRAVAQGSPFREDCFIVLDRIYDTLRSKVDQWKLRQKRHVGITSRFTDRNGFKKSKFQEERIAAACGLSAGLAYLHKQRIIHRDLKPDNFGFAINGDIKIFDFGMAREIPKTETDELYHFTGDCGSPRYMAPEVGRRLPYNESCDVYSFAMVLWEILALKRPYHNFSFVTLKYEVWNGAYERPPVDPLWSVPVKQLLERAWSPEISERPHMRAIEEILRQELVDLRKTRGCGSDSRRKALLRRSKTTV